MKLKNEIFAFVLDWLVKNKGVDGQKGLSQITGISQNTVSRIMTGKVEPSDDTLRKLNDAFGGIFNMNYLRGISTVMFIEDEIIGMVNVAAAPFMANRATEYSGSLFTSGGAFAITLNDEWDTPWTGSW